MHLSTFTAKLLGIRNQLDKKQYHQLLNHFVCSGAALSKDLGWEAQNNLQQTLKKAYEGYREMGWLQYLPPLFEPIFTQELLVIAQEPFVIAQETLDIVQKILVTAQEILVIAQESLVIAQEPLVIAQEPLVIAQESHCHCIGNPLSLLRKATVIAQETHCHCLGNPLSLHRKPTVINTT